MMTGRMLSLNADWLCAYFETEATLYEFIDSLSVPSLADWRFDPRRAEGWRGWLYKPFVLEPIDECVRYFLYIDSAPVPCRIYVNDQYVGDYIPPGDDAPPFELDVTDYVWLDDNTLAFRVECESVGGFSGVGLQAVPCDE